MSMNGQLRQIPAELMDQLDDEAVVAGLMDSDGLDVGKAWNGLHYLYCGDAHGESAIMDGEALDHGDTGYGPPTYLTPDEVASYATKLDKMPDDKLRRRYKPDDMREEKVYGGNWEDPRELDWLIEAAQKVRAFYRDAASKGAGMLVYLS
jgi:hypothetical protein